MSEQNPAVHPKAVALEVLEGDLVDQDIHVKLQKINSKTKNINSHTGNKNTI